MELLVYTHDGKVTKTTDADYSALDFMTKMADETVSYIAVGNLVLAKHSIYRVIPAGAEQ